MESGKGMYINMPACVSKQKLPPCLISEHFAGMPFTILHCAASLPPYHLSFPCLHTCMRGLCHPLNMRKAGQGDYQTWGFSHKNMRRRRRGTTWGLTLPAKGREGGGPFSPHTIILTSMGKEQVHCLHCLPERQGEHF